MTDIANIDAADRTVYGDQTYLLTQEKSRGIMNVFGVQITWERLSRTAQIPTYATPGAACADIYSDSDPILLAPGERVLVKTGLRAHIPDGFEIQIRPRSGLALKHGVTVLNTPGTIDADYRGEIGVILINHGLSEFVINRGDRIAQMAIGAVVAMSFIEGSVDTDTARGEGGFGSTGRN